MADFQTMPRATAGHQRHVQGNREVCITVNKNSTDYKIFVSMLYAVAVRYSDVGLSRRASTDHGPRLWEYALKGGQPVMLAWHSIV